MSTTVITETAPPPAPESPVRKTSFDGIAEGCCADGHPGRRYQRYRSSRTRRRRSAAHWPRNRQHSRITSEMAEEVLSEFYQMLMAHEYVLKGGIDYARKILVSAFGPEHARRLARPRQ